MGSPFRLGGEIQTPLRSGPSSRAEWQRWWKDDAGIVGVGIRETAYHNWIKGREIRILAMPHIDGRLTEAVITGISRMMLDIGLSGFRIDADRWEEQSMEKVKGALRSDGRVDGHRLGEILAAEKISNPHADVIITDRLLAIGDENWGESEFRTGYLLVSVPGARQRSLVFARDVAHHEAGHLFGYQTHHDSSVIQGYESIPECNMLWQVPAPAICEKCMDALRNFWKGIEEMSGERFLR